MTLTHRTELVLETCWCGIGHAIPSSLARQAEENGTTVYCPLGHAWSCTETEVDKLRKQVAAKTAQLDQEKARTRTLEASRNALKGEITKAKKRVGKGVCPCCNRHFANVERHMSTQHPDFADAPPVTPEP